MRTGSDSCGVNVYDLLRREIVDRGPRDVIALDAVPDICLTIHLPRDGMRHTTPTGRSQPFLPFHQHRHRGAATTITITFTLFCPTSHTFFTALKTFSHSFKSFFPLLSLASLISNCHAHLSPTSKPSPTACSRGEAYCSLWPIAVC